MSARYRLRDVGGNVGGDEIVITRDDESGPISALFTSARW